MSDRDAVLFMVEGASEKFLTQNQAEADNWGRLLSFEGYPCLSWNTSDVDLRKGKAKRCHHDPMELAGFELFRLATQPPSLATYQYGATPDEVLEQAPLWYDIAVQRLEDAKKKHGVRWMVVRGSSVLARRAAIFAAEDLGIEVYCIEDGLFQLPDEQHGAMITIVLTPRRAYYEEYPGEWAAPRAEYDADRWTAYHRWWLNNRRTKYSGSKAHSDKLAPGDVKLPPDFIAADKRVVWFGQLQGDASLHWNAPPIMPLDLFGEDVWYKAHPYGVREASIWSRKRGRWLEPGANVHQILPLCDVAAGITTNVCLEAWMYRRRVASYGEPWYAANGLCSWCIETAMSHEPDHDARFALLDWFVHDVQVPLDDARTFIQRLHGEVSNRSEIHEGYGEALHADVGVGRARRSEAGVR